MLVLSRKKDETIVVNGGIEVTILEIRGDKVRVGITAPRDVPVHRKEVQQLVEQQGHKCAGLEPIGEHAARALRHLAGAAPAGG